MNTSSQLHPLETLSAGEIDHITGAGLFGRLAGNLIVRAVDGVNATLNTVAPIGLALNLVPGVAPVHRLNDSIIDLTLNTSSAIAESLGASRKPWVTSHFKSEWR